jgi:hypothetical protein
MGDMEEQDLFAAIQTDYCCAEGKVLGGPTNLACSLQRGNA